MVAIILFEMNQIVQVCVPICLLTIIMIVSIVNARGVLEMT